MRLAYADPPYLGCGKLYAEYHPDALRWDDPMAHVELMTEMTRKYDGWALSLSAPSLRRILPLAPVDARVASWVKPFAAYKRGYPAYALGRAYFEKYTRTALSTTPSPDPESTSGKETPAATLPQTDTRPSPEDAKE